jgi:hypothetical protein
MQAVAEGEVQPQVAADVEEVGVRVAALVAVRRPDEQQHRTPFGDRLAVVLRILCDAAAEVRAGATSWSATAQAISARLAGGRTQVGPVAPLSDSVCDHGPIELYDPKSPSTHAVTALTSPSTVPQAMKSRPS